MKHIVLDWKEEGVALITFNRPEKLNAISKQMATELREALEIVRKNEKLKLVVFTGAGDRAFCAGGDLHDFHGELAEEEAYKLLYPMMEVLYTIATLPVPTLAFLNGQARGGGCELATACDFRYSNEDTAFGFVQSGLGISPGWGGGTLLYKKVRPEMAAHWLIDADMYKAERAREIGWLHKIMNKDDSFLSSLHPFLSKSEKQLRWFKKQYSSQTFPAYLKKEMEEEVRACAQLWESEEHKQAVGRFIQSRKK